MATTETSTKDMWLVFKSNEGEVFTQHWTDLVESGTLIDPDTGDDMEIIGWAVSDDDDGD